MERLKEMVLRVLVAAAMAWAVLQIRDCIQYYSVSNAERACYWDVLGYEALFLAGGFLILYLLEKNRSSKKHHKEM